jgi:predicted acyltransferase
MSDKKIGRIASLDAFRGITIAGMILVNNPGSWLHVHMKIPASPYIY